MKLIRGPLQKAIAAAATLNGKSLALLIASSLVATSGIVATSLTGTNGLSAMAQAAAQELLEERPAALAAAPAPTPAPEATPEPTQAARPAGPVTAGDPPPPATAQEEVPPTVPPAGGPEPEEPAAPAAEPEAPEAGPVKHVFLISLASPGYEAAFGATSQMPYLSATLRPQGVLLGNYSLLAASALANGFAAIGGQKPTAASEADCPAYEKCLLPVETTSLADQLTTGRFTWRAYLEGMADPTGKPANCVHPEPGATETPATGGYAAKLNPFVYFHSLLDLGDCAANDVPLTELAKDLKKADATANFSYIAPNLCNSGFRGQCPEGTADGAAAANAWLEKTVPEILSSPAYKKDGLLIVSFGAADPAPPAEPPAPPPADPLKVGALLLSPLLTPGGTDAVAYNPYSLLRSTDELFGLEPLGEAEGKKVRSFASAFVASETAAGD
ncbi:MAG TPA: alkaline phosphatase family protein [Solirubrobacterales bacterium]|nr:alkaline phosphatase family protein [Solirubrobacterales bacterium]